MTSKRNLAALGTLGGLALIALLATALDGTFLLVLCVLAMLAVLGVIALNTNTLVRSHRLAFDRAARGGGLGGRGGNTIVTAGPVGAPASQEDLTGALRLLQAQYVGRLDRAQSTLDRAAAALEQRTGPAPAPAGPLAGLPAGSVLILHAVTPATIEAARAALGAGLSVTVVAADSADREQLAAAGIAERVELAASAPDAAAVIALPVPGS